MYQLNENINTKKVHMPMPCKKDLVSLDEEIEMLTVQGSESFVTSYLTTFRNSVGEGIEEISLNYKKAVATLEVLTSQYYFGGSLLETILKTLTETLVDKSVTMLDTTLFGYGNYSIVIKDNVREAIHKRKEILYVMDYKLSKSIKGGNSNAINNIIYIYHDILNSNFHKNGFTVVNNYYPNADNPLPIADIKSLYVEAEQVLLQFCDVQAIECVITAADVE